MYHDIRGVSSRNPGPWGWSCSPTQRTHWEQDLPGMAQGWWAWQEMPRLPKELVAPPCCISIQIHPCRDFTVSALAGEPEKVGTQPSLDSPAQKYDISDPSFIKLKFILSASFVHWNNSWLTGKQQHLFHPALSYHELYTGLPPSCM